MRSSLSAKAALHAAGLALPSLLAACGDRAALSASHALQAEPLEASCRQLTDALEAAGSGCAEAPVLAVALDGWRQAVAAAGLQSRFAAEIAEAGRYATAIRVRCPTAAPAMTRLAPHKRERAEDVPARDPYAALSVTERDAVRNRPAGLQAPYRRCMDQAAIAG